VWSDVYWSVHWLQASPDAIDLLTKMLVFNPAKRITVEDALSHPFLKDLHSVRDEPVASESFDFDFERDYPEEIPKPALQDLMYRQVLGINEEERKRAARVAAASATKGTTS
jgi:serine/threonine protein kinase